MSENTQRGSRPRVLIAGGGVAALEAALALRDLVGDRVEVELCSPSRELVYRPFAIGEPDGVAGVLRFGLDWVAGQVGASFRLGGICSVDPTARRATARDGEQIDFAYLVVATGARVLWGVPGSVTFWGGADAGGVGGVIRRLRAGMLRDVVFTMPAGGSWLLPAYELALLGSAVLARSGIEDARLTVVTPEEAPLRLFGRSAGERMAGLLDKHGVEVVAGTCPVEFDGELLRVASGDPIATDAVVSLPRLEGIRTDGLAHDEAGFLPVDEHCRVAGAEQIFATGDATSCPVKQVGIATQQADVAAEAIAAAIGCDLEPAAFDPVLHLRPVPDGELVGRYLTPFLAVRGDAGRRALAPD